MLLLTTLVFWLAGICDGVQRLTCPYDLKDEDLPRVWCKETSPQCCSGFSFSRESQSLDAGRLKVTQGVDSFIVDVLGLAQGEGMYWCGVLSSNKTIIKLAEEYFYSSLRFLRLGHSSLDSDASAPHGDHLFLLLLKKKRPKQEGDGSIHEHHYDLRSGTK
uniref:uncharacterized protein si:ch211-102c2.4 isoform X2 n=1 Tax=Oncorhynchus gorbuscha TaxID=8017 RepID=UPI001EAEB44F|nr:uncharacterized protein si:ch211-102c2.4 isoform X2 [Oncorhynchus gorbuscha]